jgi:hypothetical protein
MNEFLKLEYERCLDLLKYYDERQLSLTKFTVTGSSAIVSALFALSTAKGLSNPEFWRFAAMLSGTAGIGLLTIYAAMVQNRLYFVYPVRQANAIRRKMMELVVNEFADNQMYLTTNVRPFKFLSLQSLMMGLVAMHVSAFLVGARFCIAHSFNPPIVCITCDAVLFSISTALLFLASAYIWR